MSRSKSHFYWHGAVDIGTWLCQVQQNSSETQVSYTLENIVECSSEGALKMVVHSKWLLFRQVAHLRSIMLLIWFYIAFTPEPGCSIHLDAVCVSVVTSVYFPIMYELV